MPQVVIRWPLIGQRDNDEAKARVRAYQKNGNLHACLTWAMQLKASLRQIVGQAPSG